MPISPHTLQYGYISAARECGGSSSPLVQAAESVAMRLQNLTTQVVSVSRQFQSDLQARPLTCGTRILTLCEKRQLPKNHYNYWPRSRQLTREVLCAEETRPSLVCDHQLMHALGWSAVVFCACEVTLLFSAASCVVRAVHKFDCRLVINGKPNKRRPLERRSNSDKIYMFSPYHCYKTLSTLCRSTAFSWGTLLHSWTCLHQYLRKQQVLDAASWWKSEMQIGLLVNFHLTEH